MDCHLKLQRPMSQDFDLLSWNLSLPRPLSCKKSRNLNNKMFWKTRNYLTQKVSLPLLTHNIGKQYLWNIRMRDFIFYTYLVMIFYTILDWYWEGGGQNWTRNSNCGGGTNFFLFSIFFLIVDLSVLSWWRVNLYFLFSTGFFTLRQKKFFFINFRNH